MEPDQLLHEREPDAGAFVGASSRVPDPMEPFEEDTGPRGVAAQSMERMSAPISPPPARQSAAEGWAGSLVDGIEGL